MFARIFDIVATAALYFVATIPLAIAFFGYSLLVLRPEWSIFDTSDIFTDIAALVFSMVFMVAGYLSLAEVFEAHMADRKARKENR